MRRERMNRRGRYVLGIALLFVGSVLVQGCQASKKRKDPAPRLEASPLAESMGYLHRRKAFATLQVPADLMADWQKGDNEAHVWGFPDSLRIGLVTNQDVSVHFEVRPPIGEVTLVSAKPSEEPSAEPSAEPGGAAGADEGVEDAAGNGAAEPARAGVPGPEPEPEDSAQVVKGYVLSIDKPELLHGAVELEIFCYRIDAAAKGEELDLYALEEAGDLVRAFVPIFPEWSPEAVAEAKEQSAQRLAVESDRVQMKILGSDPWNHPAPEEEQVIFRVLPLGATGLDDLRWAVEPATVPLSESKVGGILLLKAVPEEFTDADSVTLHVFGKLEDGGNRSPYQRMLRGEYVTHTLFSETAAPPEVSLNVLDKQTAERIFGETFAQEFYACAVHINNPSEDTLILYGSSVASWALFSSKEYHPFWSQYRPLSYTSILESLSDINRHNENQVLIDHLETIGELAAGASVFMTGPDYGDAVALFTGVFIPELRKHLLEDILTHLTNLENLGFREVEEVGPRSEVTKYLFLPRGPILGLLGNKTPVYIVSVDDSKVGIDGYRVLTSEAVQSDVDEP